MNTESLKINNIYLGDCYELIKRVPDKSIDLIITDPPYDIVGLHIGTGLLRGRKNTHVDKMMETNLGGGIDLSILDEFVRVLKKINIYIWCNKEQLYNYLTYFVEKQKCKFEIIFWGKNNPAPFVNGHYLKDKEYCLFFWQSGVKLYGNYHTLNTFYEQNTNIYDKKDYGHPTIKPLDIIKNLIFNSSLEKQVILDPFLGSGTTAVACKELKRNFIGIEIDENYYRIATDRLQGTKANGETSLFDTDFEQLSLLGDEDK